jgi:hypothetical protein
MTTGSAIAATVLGTADQARRMSCLRIRSFRDAEVGSALLCRARLPVYPTLRFGSKTVACPAHRAEPRVWR